MLCELRISTDFCLLASHTYCDYFLGNVERARKEDVCERKREEGGGRREEEGEKGMYACTFIEERDNENARIPTDTGGHRMGET